MRNTHKTISRFIDKSNTYLLPTDTQLTLLVVGPTHIILFCKMTTDEDTSQHPLHGGTDFYHQQCHMMQCPDLPAYAAIMQQMQMEEMHMQQSIQMGGMSTQQQLEMEAIKQQSMYQMQFHHDVQQHYQDIIHNPNIYQNIPCTSQQPTNVVTPPSQSDECTFNFQEDTGGSVTPEWRSGRWSKDEVSFTENWEQLLDWVNSFFSCELEFLDSFCSGTS